jgi:hypothetical protein
VHVTAETATKLKDLAATSGRAPEDIEMVDDPESENCQTTMM